MVYTRDGQSAYVTDNPTGLAEGQRSLPLFTTPPQREWVGLDLDEMDAIINGNIKITDSRLRDGVYGVVLDTMTTLMEKNNIEPWREENV